MPTPSSRKRDAWLPKVFSATSCHSRPGSSPTRSAPFRIPRPREQYDVAAGGWFFSKELGGGGHLTILGCHYLDLLRHIAGSDFKSVSAFCRNVGGEAITVEDAAVVNLEFQNGMVGNLNSGYYTSSAEYGSSRHNGLIIWGRDGWLKFNPNGESNREPMQWASYSGSQASAPLKSWTFDKARRPEQPLPCPDRRLLPRLPGPGTAAHRARSRYVGQRSDHRRLRVLRFRPDAGGLHPGGLGPEGKSRERNPAYVGER